MEEAEELSQEVFLVDRGTVIERGEVKALLSRFSGKLRAESHSPIDGATQISNTFIKYIQSGEVEKYASMGCTIKRITLDDIFINRGVDVES